MAPIAFGYLEGVAVVGAAAEGAVIVDVDRVQALRLNAHGLVRYQRAQLVVVSVPLLVGRGLLEAAEQLIQVVRVEILEDVLYVRAGLEVAVEPSVDPGKDSITRFIDADDGRLTDSLLPVKDE